MKQILKFIYKNIPFKTVVFKGVRMFRLPESIYKHLYFKGVFRVKIKRDQTFQINHYGFQVENDIFWSGLFGRWEKDSLLLWSRLCEKSDVIFDIGANTGVYSLIAKAVNKNNNVYAFDPVKRVYEKLVQNIELNNYDIKPYQIALSNNTGVAKIYDTDSEHTYSVTVNKNLNTTKSKVTEIDIETLRLDEFIPLNNINKIDLMKIDVETHEPEVLEGMGKYLRNYKPTLLIEILNDEIAGKIECLIQDLDYIYFNLNEQGSIQKVDSLTKSDYHNFLICTTAVALDLNLLD
ncbi:MAG: FkbM family methyltransferase [Flavobacteriales bacterium]|nr:FkbM family methyltransferase [Flavobacteriales bacterium]